METCDSAVTRTTGIEHEQEKLHGEERAPLTERIAKRMTDGNGASLWWWNTF